MPNVAGEPLILESGRVILATGEVEALEVDLKGTLIEIDIKDRDFAKRLIKLRGEIGKLMPKAAESQIEESKKKKTGALAMVRTVAEALCSRGITVTVAIEGDTILTLGAEAHPTLLQLITRTKGVAVNRFFKLVGLML